MCYWHYIMWASSKVSAPGGSTGLIGKLCLFKCTQLSGAYWGGEKKQNKFHSHPSIMLTEQLLTLVNLNQVFLYSCQTASGKHWMKLESFYWSVNTEEQRCHGHIYPELCAITQHDPFNAGEGVLLKLASDVPQLNFNGKVVWMWDWLLTLSTLSAMCIDLL